MFNKDNFIEASFVDNERQNIEILTKSEDGKTVIPTVIPYDENNDMFKELMTIKTIDQLHEDTHNKKKEESRLFELFAMDVVKQKGLVLEKDINKLDTKFYPTVVKSLLTDISNIDHIFALKLAFFEVKSISESEDIEGKKKLRQAKNKLEVIDLALKIINGK